MEPRIARKGEVNGSLVDRYSIFHAAAGAVLADHGVSASTALLLSLGFELTENTLKAKIPNLFPAQSRDAPINMVGDILSVMAGWAIVGRKRRTRVD